MKSPIIKTFKSKKELAHHSAQFLVHLASKSIKEKGRFSIALSGGSTPKLLYQTIIEQYKEDVDWSKVDFFWSDERYVPIHHSDSNMKLALDYLLYPLLVKRDNIYLINTSLKDPVEAAKLYEENILEYFGNRPQFDLILLGLGDDGHTASLFPNTKALNELGKQVTANWMDKFQTWRLTFTFPLLNNAKNVMFIVSGNLKSSVLKDILTDKNTNFPAARVSPQKGELFWFLDREAASQLT
jgi:6-phosphogluconolactonase